MRVGMSLLVGAMILLTAGAALADEEVACDSTCSDGKVMVSFSDGNHAHCLCQAPGDGMNNDTVANAQDTGDDVAPSVVPPGDSEGAG